MPSSNPIVLNFIDVTTIPESELRALLAIRNEPAVRQNMYNDHEISWEEHLSWLGRLKQLDDQKNYAVYYDGSLVGGAGISSYDGSNKRADWAFYITGKLQGKGIGSALERQFIDFVLDKFDIDKLNCEVIEYNDRVIAMHQRFGFLREGVRREHVVRGERKYDVVLLGITRREWESSLPKSSKDYNAIIDQIQSIRSKNNKNWMDLLRLAFKHAPNEAADIVADIYREDKEISDLAAKLVQK